MRKPSKGETRIANEIVKSMYLTPPMVRAIMQARPPHRRGRPTMDVQDKMPVMEALRERNLIRATEINANESYPLTRLGLTVLDALNTLAASE